MLERTKCQVKLLEKYCFKTFITALRVISLIKQQENLALLIAWKRLDWDRTFRGKTPSRNSTVYKNAVT